ncbi:Polymyxin resistance protein PmrJ, predicted deacetylase [Candidatus Nitrotoga sp. BS]|uniref:polysaccharide deacetylase family protein n=1 Tax=Candidatus Nitrotoga sp. BS TaxID=2890408 RepID=UPI001EF3A674|nr:polysaccharide deacetylase family protein [Candidatus Nitrotoga sp. BS]CAH1212734.1 Polymyxin resistance protein PmrJ, predicted deacetylase [Candidatus Nitrotoga sp. BS]
MPQLALKIDVDTYRGTREGVPRLVEMLKRHNVQATFFFTLGPDHTGRAIRRVFRPGFLGKVSRTSVLEHYGIKTLLYGTLLPGPDIGRHCVQILRSVRDAGFEVGIHCYDHIRWQDYVAGKDGEWTRREMQRAVDRFIEIFGEAPKAHAAAGWQMNRHALRLMQVLGFDYSSDTRGIHPFIPTWDAEIVACPQLPTTLPTLDEIINREGVTLENVAQHILRLTALPPTMGHVYTLHAELEGGKWMPVFEQLITGWKEQGYELVSMHQYFEKLKGTLPLNELVIGTVDGRSGTLAMQGK